MLAAAASPAPLTSRRGAAARALAVALLTGALALAVAPSLTAQSSEHRVERRYKVRFLNSSDAQAIAQNLCPVEARCDVSPMGLPGELRVIAEAATQEVIAKALQAADVPPAAQAFQLVLLEAHRGGTAIPEGLPASVRKALADVGEFLPYGRFDLIAPVGFVRTTREARVTVASDEDVSYELELAFRGDPRQAGAELLVDRFLLRLVPAEPMALALAMHPGFTAGAAPPRRAPAKPGDNATPSPPAARGGSTPGAGAPDAGTPAPQAAITPPPTVAENLLSTSFAIRKGETVVVGTSKLNGNDRALVVLLTALP